MVVRRNAADAPPHVELHEPRRGHFVLHDAQHAGGNVVQRVAAANVAEADGYVLLPLESICSQIDTG